MNQAEKDFRYLAEEIWPWLKYLEKRRQREKIVKSSSKPVITKPMKNRRGLQKFVP